MRWIPFLIFAYVFALVQTALGKIIAFDGLGVVLVGPDLMVLLAVFIALNARDVVDGMLAGWAMGFLIDLTTAGGAGDPTRLGPMAFAYVLCVWIVFLMREVLYRERVLTQVILAFFFCIATHLFWVIVQNLLAGGQVDYGSMFLQMLLVAAYTAVLMPLMNYLLNPCRGLIIASAVRQSRRTKGFSSRRRR